MSIFGGFFQRSREHIYLLRLLVARLIVRIIYTFRKTRPAASCARIRVVNCCAIQVGRARVPSYVLPTRSGTPAASSASRLHADYAAAAAWFTTSRTRPPFSVHCGTTIYTRLCAAVMTALLNNIIVFFFPYFFFFFFVPVAVADETMAARRACPNVTCHCFVGKQASAYTCTSHLTTACRGAWKHVCFRGAPPNAERAEYRCNIITRIIRSERIICRLLLYTVIVSRRFLPSVDPPCRTSTPCLRRKSRTTAMHGLKYTYTYTGRVIHLGCVVRVPTYTAFTAPLFNAERFFFPSRKTLVLRTHTLY